MEVDEADFDEAFEEFSTKDATGKETEAALPSTFLAKLSDGTDGQSISGKSGKDVTDASGGGSTDDPPHFEYWDGTNLIENAKAKELQKVETLQIRLSSLVNAAAPSVFA